MQTQIKQATKVKQNVKKLTPSQKFWLKRKGIQDDPIALCRDLGKKHSHAIIYKPKSGFAFMIFRGHKVSPEPVCKSAKVYKTKADCIFAIKKLCDTMPGGISTVYPLNCWDYLGMPIDLKVKTSYWSELQ